MKILDTKQIKQKIVRLAHEIAENNYQQEEIILIGINNNGLGFAKLIEESLKKIISSKITINQVRLDPADPPGSEIKIREPIEFKASQSIIVVDDVANTGRTIFYAFKPFFEYLPEKIEVAVLVDRKHKNFPIEVNYVGLSLATTIGQNIDVKLSNKSSMEVNLN